MLDRTERYLSLLVATEGLEGAVSAGYSDLSRRALQVCLGGDRLRSRLVLRAHEALGGDRGDAAVGLAAAYEALHAALLLHEGAIDSGTCCGSESAEATPNWSVSQSHDGGTSPASSSVVLGDLALHLAHRALMRSCARLPLPLAARLEAIFHRAVTVAAVGRLTYVAAQEEAGEFTVDESLEVSYARTGVHKIEAPLTSGAILAGASSEVVGALEKFARFIGTASQVREDLQLALGNLGSSGRSDGNEMPIANATALGVLAQRSEWAPDFSATLESAREDGDYRMVRHFLHKRGAVKWCEEQIYSLHATAERYLLEIPQPLRNDLVDIADSAVARYK